MLLRSGLTISQAITHAGGATSGRHAALAPGWSSGCAGGEGLAPQLARAGEEPLAVALVAAGEASGRLPELCQELSELYDHRRALRSLFIGRLVYPLFLVHMTMLAGGVVGWVRTGSALGLLLAPLLFWSAIAVAALVLVAARRSGLAARWALLPGARSLTLPLVTGNTCLVLRAGLSAGMLYHQALDLAANACGNRVVAADLRRVAGDLAGGRTPDLLTALTGLRFPRPVLQLVQTGEQSGTLEDALGRAATLQREAFRERTLWATRIAAGTCYAAAMGFAVWTIMGMAMGYIDQITSISAELDG